MLVNNQTVDVSSARRDLDWMLQKALEATPLNMSKGNMAIRQESQNRFNRINLVITMLQRALSKEAQRVVQMEANVQHAIGGLRLFLMAIADKPGLPEDIKEEVMTQVQAIDAAMSPPVTDEIPPPVSH